MCRRTQLVDTPYGAASTTAQGDGRGQEQGAGCSQAVGHNRRVRSEMIVVGPYCLTAARVVTSWLEQAQGCEGRKQATRPSVSLRNMMHCSLLRNPAMSFKARYHWGRAHASATITIDSCRSCA